MNTRFKRGSLRISQTVGLFHIARRRTGHGLRILCYHGVSLSGEDRFRPKLFIDPAIFRHRLEFLAENRFPVLSLETALALLQQASLPPGATVITIDDGFYGVYRAGLPLLKEFGFPATLYVTSYYSLKQSPIFRLVVQYMFWKTTRRQLDLTGLGVGIEYKISMSDLAAEQTLWRLIEYGETKCEENQRTVICCGLGERLGVDYGEIAKSRILSLANARELQEMASAGVDIQLHTHRHRFPELKQAAMKELSDNKMYLEPLVRTPLRHFCYPSGIFAPVHRQWLRAAGIESGVTCVRGFAYWNTDLMVLPRILDGSNISQVEFKSEMLGYTELLRLGAGHRGRIAAGQLLA